MPVTFTALAGDLDVTLIDTNLATWQDLFRAGVTEADIAGRFDRFRIRRFTSGKIRSVRYFANPHREPTSEQTFQQQERFDLTYRTATENAGLMAAALPRESGEYRHAYEMELLGAPGPSWHYTFQEDQVAIPLASVSGSAGFPSPFPPTRYPSDKCYSRLLTVPGCSFKEYVKHPCIARISANAKGSVSMWGAIRYGSVFGALIPELWMHKKSRHDMHARFALVADTNPVLYADEFVNNNPNVINPSTGLQATHKTWKIIDDVTRDMAQREVIQLWGEIPLVGGRDYNFSMKFTDALTHGYVDTTGGGAGAWKKEMWEWSSGHPNAPTLGAYYAARVIADGEEMPQAPTWVNLWESGSIGVEFIYGRDEAYVNDSTDVEFLTKA